MKPPILILGPTASGKTDLAIALAKRLDGEVVNADSMQVYQDLRLLTDRPRFWQLNLVPHHLFGHIDGSVRYSVGAWLEAASELISNIRSRNKTPIIVGGTGLYFNALFNGISEYPPIEESVKNEVRTLIESEGVDGLYKRLGIVDPKAVLHIKRSDRQRISRAYEVWLTSGIAYSEFRAQKSQSILSDLAWLAIALYPDRRKLYARIESRFDNMLPQGIIEEVEKLLDRQLNFDMPIMRAHGVPWIRAYLRGEKDLEETCELIKRDIRRYAKRQYTWIGRQFPDWPRIPSMEIEDRLDIINSLYEVVDQ